MHPEAEGPSERGRAGAGVFAILFPHGLPADSAGSPREFHVLRIFNMLRLIRLKPGRLLGMAIFAALALASPKAHADISYTLHLDGVDAGIQSQISASMAEAVALFNRYGSFNKQLNVYYSSGVPTAQANYDGVITFGGSRNTRVALHEMAHTLGGGTYWAWPNLMTGGTWDGALTNARLSTFDGAGSILHGDTQHFWPYGLNYDSEDGFIARIRSIRIVAALRCDMGILSYIDEPASQVVAPGAEAVFTARAAGASSYAWYRTGEAAPLADGGAISGARTDTLRIADMNREREGTYFCVASGLRSRPAHLMMRRLVARWNFDGNARDAIGTDDGTPVGAVGYAEGKFGQALRLDGSGAAVTLPAGIADSDKLTVAAWVYWNGGGQWQRIFDFGTGTEQNIFLTPRSGGNTLRFAIKDNGLEQSVETGQLATGQWVHLAAVLDAETARLYVNGALAASTSGIENSPLQFLPTANSIGDSQYSADPPFNGMIDDLRMYNDALDGARIAQLYAAAESSAARPRRWTGYR